MCHCYKGWEVAITSWCKAC